MCGVRQAMEAYNLAGMRLHYWLPLPGHDPHVGGGAFSLPDDVVIRRARVPDSLSTVRLTFPEGQLNESEFLLKIPGVGRYLLRHGNEILVDQVPRSDLTELCAYLL